MVGMLHGLQVQAKYVSQVRTLWFLIHRTFIQPGVFRRGCIHRIDVHNGKIGEKDLWLGFDQPAIPSVPPGAIYKQSMDVDALCWSGSDVFLHVLGDVVAEDNAIQCPAFVSAGYLLTHGGQESLELKK